MAKNQRKSLSHMMDSARRLEGRLAYDVPGNHSRQSQDKADLPPWQASHPASIGFKVENVGDELTDY